MEFGNLIIIKKEYKMKIKSKNHLYKIYKIILFIYIFKIDMKCIIIRCI